MCRKCNWLPSLCFILESISIILQFCFSSQFVYDLFMFWRDLHNKLVSEPNPRSRTADFDYQFKIEGDWFLITDSRSQATNFWLPNSRSRATDFWLPIQVIWLLVSVFWSRWARVIVVCLLFNKIMLRDHVFANGVDLKIYGKNFSLWRIKIQSSLETTRNLDTTCQCKTRFDGWFRIYITRWKSALNYLVVIVWWSSLQGF